MSEKEDRVLEQVLLGNQSAIHLARLYAHISHTFDDLVDNDQEVTTNDIYDVLRLLLVDIHYNEFWQQYSGELLPLVATGLRNWIASNDIEKNQDVNLMHVSMIKKSAATEIILHMAEILGGPTHVRNVAPMVYRHVFDETYEEYLEEHGVTDELYQEAEEAAGHGV